MKLRTHYVRNVSFTIAECSIMKSSICKNHDVAYQQTMCRVLRRPVLNIIPPNEFMNNKKPFRPVTTPLSLEQWMNNQFGILYLSNPFEGISEDGVVSFFDRAHLVSDRVFVCLPMDAGLPDVGEWIYLAPLDDKDLYEHCIKKEGSKEP